MASIDPRLLTTPIGGAIGLLVAKRILRDKDENLVTLGTGAGIGAGAGYLAGEMAMARPSNVQPTGDPAADRATYNKARAAGEFKGEASPAELNLIASGYSDDLLKGTRKLYEDGVRGPISNIRQGALNRKRARDIPDIVKQMAYQGRPSAEEQEWANSGPPTAGSKIQHSFDWMGSIMDYVMAETPGQQ